MRCPLPAVNSGVWGEVCCPCTAVRTSWFVAQHTQAFHQSQTAGKSGEETHQSYPLHSHKSDQKLGWMAHLQTHWCLLLPSHHCLHQSSSTYPSNSSSLMSSSSGIGMSSIESAVLSENRVTILVVGGLGWSITTTAHDGFLAQTTTARATQQLLAVACSCCKVRWVDLPR